MLLERLKSLYNKYRLKILFKKYKVDNEQDLENIIKKTKELEVIKNKILNAKKIKFNPYDIYSTGNLNIKTLVYDIDTYTKFLGIIARDNYRIENSDFHYFINRYNGMEKDINLKFFFTNAKGSMFVNYENNYMNFLNTMEEALVRIVEVKYGIKDGVDQFYLRISDRFYRNCLKLLDQLLQLG